MDTSPYGSEPRTISLTAPLDLETATKIRAPPSAIKPALLTGIPDISTQQALVAKDLLFAFLGHQGHYVRYSERYQHFLLRDRIRGPDYKVAAPLDISLKTVTKKLARFGKYYTALTNFAQIYNTQKFGRVNQRLCTEIARVLARFRRLVMSFEQAFYHDPYFSLSTMDNELQNTVADPMKHLYEIACAVHEETEARNPRFLTATSVSLAISGEFSGRDTRFDTFLNLIRTDVNLGANVSSDPNAFDVCKGGLVLRIVEGRIAQFEGDMKSLSFLYDLFEAISVDYVVLLNMWLVEGEVDDIFHEFVVKKNDLPKNIFYSNVERYWEELYVIKIDGLIDRFLDKELQAKILATGKFLNIFKRCIGTATLQDFPENVSTVACPEKITSLFSQDLHSKILQFYDRANNLLLKLLFRGYHFSDMLSSLHSTYLLCESSKIDTFFDRTLHDLGKNKNNVSTVSLTDTFNDVFSLGTVERRVQHLSTKHLSTKSRIDHLLRTFQNFSVDSNNFYDLSEEIISIRSFDAATAVAGDEQASSAIKKLVNQSLRQPASSADEQNKADQSKQNNQQKDKQSVIAAVNIDCELPFPVNLMISENYIFEFQLVFKLQMLLKYASKVIDAAWCDTMHSSVWNYKEFSEPLKKLVLRSRVLIFRMKNFVTQLMNYVDHFVIDSNYNQLLQSVHSIDASLEKSRPQSRTTRSSSPFKDAPKPLTKQGNINSIFDEKIKSVSNRQVSNIKFGPEATHHDAYELSESIGTYLSNILRDSMITNSQLLENLRTSLRIVTDYTSITSRLKKTCILTDATLLAAFARDYPGKFEGTEIDDGLIKHRINGMNAVITRFWNEFNFSLKRFTLDLQAASTENAAYIALIDRISVV